jgi:FAD/FMN-containing dehydrogenase
MSLTKRVFLLGVGAGAGAWITRQVAPQMPDAAGMALIDPKSDVTCAILNDASLLSETPVHSHVVLRDTVPEALAKACQTEMTAAASQGRAVNIGAARHSMGGQAIPAQGHAITLDHAQVTAVAGAETYRVTAGTRWRDVIATLDPLGLSPLVMQSNHDFGVAATFSVNAHGWPSPLGPMGSSVRSIGLVLADGSHVRASRDENAPLFFAAMGGYGLIGLITDVELRATANQLLMPTYDHMAAPDFAAAFVAAMSEAVPMAYGRLNVDRARFFADAMLVTWRPIDGEIPPAGGSGFLSRASRPIFRAQVGNEWVKRRRWGIEAGLGAQLAGSASRNSLLNEPVVTLDDRDPTRTDILHEYFVSPDRFGDFLVACREIIPASYQDLLNITLRWVERDRESLLSYAPDGPRIASVLLFSQEMSVRAEADMAQMTERLIEAVIGMGGAYYLPYRPHARPDQFLKSYPRAEEFVALKRQVDPDLRFRNGLWDRYMAML